MWICLLNPPVKHTALRAQGTELKMLFWKREDEISDPRLPAFAAILHRMFTPTPIHTDSSVTAMNTV